jgi:hypothetical protein
MSLRKSNKRKRPLKRLRSERKSCWLASEKKTKESWPWKGCFNKLKFKLLEERKEKKR